MVKLSTPQKLDYLHRARDVTGHFNDVGSFTDELDHMLVTYGTLSDIARRAVYGVLEGLPLQDQDEILNAFVGRQLLIETEYVLADRLDVQNGIEQSLWDVEWRDDRDLDRDISEKSKQEDEHRRRQWNAGAVASEVEIAESAYEDTDIPRLFKDPLPRVIQTLERPTVLLAKGITMRCRDAMVPLIRSFFCRNTVRDTMRRRIENIHRFALQLSAHSDEDEFQML